MAHDSEKDRLWNFFCGFIDRDPKLALPDAVTGAFPAVFLVGVDCRNQRRKRLFELLCLRCH